MNHKQYREAIERLGLSQVAAARLLQVDPRTSRRWASGETKVPWTVAVVLEYLAKERTRLAMEALARKRR